jgi:hypothetical protein
VTYESIRLDRGIGAGDRANEGTLSNIWETGNEERACVRVDIRQSAQMLADLIEV